MVNVQTHGNLIYMEVDALSTAPAMREYLDAMERILSEYPQFGLMLLNDMDDADIKAQKRTKEANKLSRQWLKANRERIGEQCIGIAMVVKPTAMMRAMKPMAAKTMKKIMGAQGDLFFERAKAEDWLQTQLQAAQLQERGLK